jgi:hypothetical protein
MTDEMRELLNLSVTVTLRRVDIDSTYLGSPADVREDIEANYKMLKRLVDEEK